MPARQAARPASDRSSSMPACWRMKVTSGQARASSAAVVHLRREDLEVEAPAVVGEPRDVAPKRRVGGEVRPRGEAVLRVLVPVQLHADAAHQREPGEAVELRAHVLDGEIGIGDDRVRPAASRRRPICTQAASSSKRVGRPVGLDIDRARRRRSRRCRRGTRRSGSRAGSARRGRRCAAASARRATADRPGARCGDGRRRSRSCGAPLTLGPSACAGTTASSELPSASSSMKGRMP